MEEWMMDGCVPESVAMPSRSKWAYEVETWGGRGILEWWAWGGPVQIPGTRLSI